jgi:hypothetical protein
MKSGVIVGAVLLAVAGGSPPAGAQETPNLELYHVQFVKAAPGKLGALIEAHLKAPADPADAEPPLIFRHAQGDDWQLMILSPMGKEHTIRAEQPSAAQQQFIQQLRGLSARHDDTITLGPPWAQARKVLLGDGEAGAVYIVSAFEPVPGQRQQLLKALTEGPNADASTTLILQHLEGAPWQLLTITRYASWVALGEAMERQRKQTPGVPPTAEHTAAHRDTIVERVTGPIK